LGEAIPKKTIAQNDEGERGARRPSLEISPKGVEKKTDLKEDMRGRK